MKRLFSILTLSIVSLSFVSSPAFAAKPVSSTEPVGYDISYPQCGTKLPTGQAFGIVGVNGGTAATTNSCMTSELVWANKSLGTTAQDKLQLYVNTANPGEVISQITTWPTTNTDKTGYSTTNPYGTCAGQNDLPCSWQYGWNRAVEDNLDRFKPAAQAAGVNTTSPHKWWLDVETMNTWQSGSTGALARNAASLEGMTSYFTSQNAPVGLYSTASQWSAIAGTVAPGSNLNGLANWRPSGASLSNAKANCSVAPLTSGGFISLTQYVEQNLDKNHSCI